MSSKQEAITRGSELPQLWYVGTIYVHIIEEKSALESTKTTVPYPMDDR